jgi:toxin FitB
MILVDTNVWSEATKSEPDQAVRQWANANQDRLWLSTIVLAELRAGSALMPAGQRRDRFAAEADALVTVYAERLLTFDEAASRAYGFVLESAKRLGRPIKTADAMIAATAMAHGMSVATRDTGDFAGAGVALINPWET